MESFGIGIILVLYLLLAVVRRQDALAVLVASLPLYLVRFSIGPLPSTLLEGMIIILFLVWAIEKRGVGGVIRCIVQRISCASRGERMLLLFLYLLVMSATLSVAVSTEPRAALGVWRAYFIEPALFFIVLLDTITTRAQLVRLFSASVLSGAVVALVAVYQKFTGWNIPEPWAGERRATSIFPYPNAVGLYCAPLVWLAAARARMAWSERKAGAMTAWIGAGLIMIIALVFSKTEAAVVALAATAIGVGLAWGRLSRVIVAAGACFIAITLFFIPTISAPVLEKMLLHDWSGQVRIATWQETIAMIQDHPFTGVGLAGYKAAMAPYHTHKYLEIFLYPHNIVLNFWSETGLYGLISFLLVCAAAAILLFRARRDRVLSYAYMAALATVLIHGIVDVPYFKNDLSVQFWFLVGGSIILQRFSK